MHLAVRPECDARTLRNRFGHRARQDHSSDAVNLLRVLCHWPSLRSPPHCRPRRSRRMRLSWSACL